MKFDQNILEKKYKLVLEKKSQLERVEYWNSHPNYKKNRVYFVLLSELLPFAEVDRNDPKNRFTNMDKLVEDISENGIQEPLVLAINKATKKALVTDGNHRLVAAKQANMNFVPVVLESVFTNDPEWGLKTKKIPLGKINTDHLTAKDFGFTGYTVDELMEFIKKRDQKPIKESNIFYSWMDPEGKLHFFKNTHGDFAKSFAETPMERENYLENMFGKGWLRLNYYGNTAYAHNSIQPPNKIQKRELKNLAIEQGIDKVVWDAEEYEKILWTSENIVY